MSIPQYLGLTLQEYVVYYFAFLGLIVVLAKIVRVARGRQ